MIDITDIKVVDTISVSTARIQQLRNLISKGVMIVPKYGAERPIEWPELHAKMDGVLKEMLQREEQNLNTILYGEQSQKTDQELDNPQEAGVSS